MANKSNNEEEIATYTEAYYEELAYEGEIYLEETEEELRAYLLSLVPDFAVCFCCLLLFMV